MARPATKVFFVCLIGTACSLKYVQAEDLKRTSYVIFAPGQSETTTTALADLFSKSSSDVSIHYVKTLPEAIASQDDIAVLALSLAQFNALGPCDADALKKRKVIGIGFGAAKLFETAGLKVRAGWCAHGMEPRIRIEDNTMVAKEGFGKEFGVYDPSAQQQPSQDVEVMTFGIFTGYPTVHQGLEDLDVITRFSSDLGYTPVVREGNTVLIGFNPHAEDWTDLFRGLIGKVAVGLNKPLKNPVEKLVASHGPQTLEGDWAVPDRPGRVMRLTKMNNGRACSIEWLPGDANASENGFKPTRFDLLGDNVGATELPYGFAMWDHGFKLDYFTARLENDELVIESYSIFKDDSQRSNYRQVGKMKRAVQTANDVYPSLKRVPNFFSWEYSDQPEPGKRVWIRVDDTTFIERYPSGHENHFQILRSDKAHNVDGIVLQISDSSLQAFIPYKAVSGDATHWERSASKSLTAEKSAASASSEPAKLLMRSGEQSPWQLMGEMQHVE